MPDVDLGVAGIGGAHGLVVPDDVERVEAALLGDAGGGVVVEGPLLGPKVAAPLEQLLCAQVLVPQHHHAALRDEERELVARCGGEVFHLEAGQLRADVHVDVADAARGGEEVRLGLVCERGAVDDVVERFVRLVVQVLREGRLEPGVRVARLVLADGDVVGGRVEVRLNELNKDFFPSVPLRSAAFSSSSGASRFSFLYLSCCCSAALLREGTGAEAVAVGAIVSCDVLTVIEGSSRCTARFCLCSLISEGIDQRKPISVGIRSRELTVCYPRI